jgi:hypothetical protein
MKNINDNPCENCCGKYCHNCPYSHEGHKRILPKNGEEHHIPEGLLLDCEDDEFEYLDPYWEDDDFDDDYRLGTDPRDALDDWEADRDDPDEFSYYDEMWGRNARMAEKSNPDSSKDFSLGE